MIRAAAKNHDDVAVIVDVDDYPALIDELRLNAGATSLAFRRRMAQKAYARTAVYDAAISNWLAREVHEPAPKWRAFGGVLHPSFGALRYGENPHQNAALYLTAETRPGVATARQVQGKELSYNNINDTDAAYELAAEFDPGESAAVGDHQARQPMRRRRSARRSSRPTRRRWPAIRSRPSAASSRSTGGSTRRARARSSRCSPK